jgi:hypothetical protein
MAIRQQEYHKWPRQRARIAELFLDPLNIRLEVPVQASQQSLINDLFLNENAMQVLESIAQNGFFPDELPVVVKERGKLVVMEGNRVWPPSRRSCARNSWPRRKRRSNSCLRVLPLFRES